MTDRPEFTAGCGYLSVAELEAAIHGRLSPERQAEFDRHIDGGCAPCVTLAADIGTFRRLASGGVLESERREHELQAEPLRALLRATLRKRQTSGS